MLLKFAFQDILDDRRFKNTQSQVKSELIKNSPAKKVKLLKDDVRVEVFSDEQITQILNFCLRIKR